MAPVERFNKTKNS